MNTNVVAAGNEPNGSTNGVGPIARMNVRVRRWLQFNWDIAVVLCVAGYVLYTNWDALMAGMNV